MPYTQEGRLISLTTPLGADKLLLAGFSGHEAISRLFSFIWICSAKLSTRLRINAPPINFSDITARTSQSRSNSRMTNPATSTALVSHFAQSAPTACYPYQMKSFPDVVLTRYAIAKSSTTRRRNINQAGVFRPRIHDFKLSLSGSYTPLEYTVQYRETDFNFISRLMEQNASSTSSSMRKASTRWLSLHLQRSRPSRAAKRGIEPGQRRSRCGRCHQLLNIEQVEKRQYTLTDYNFKTSSTSLLASEPTIDSIGGNADFELFDYPGEYAARSDGTAFAKLRMQEVESATWWPTARAFAAPLPADTIRPRGPLPGLNEHVYVLTEIQHIASAAEATVARRWQRHRQRRAIAVSDTYSNQFTCIPATVRSVRTPHAEALCAGPQTAKVVAGARIRTRTTTRVRVEMAKRSGWTSGQVLCCFLDRKGATSCWMRVSQDWAGQGWE